MQSRKWGKRVMESLSGIPASKAAAILAAVEVELSDATGPVSREDRSAQPELVHSDRC
jgi:hypothetical protein